MLSVRRTSLAVATSCVYRTVTVVVVEQRSTLATVQARILRLTYCISCGNHPSVLQLPLLTDKNDNYENFSYISHEHELLKTCIQHEKGCIKQWRI